MEESYLDVLSKNVLNEVKRNVGYNHIILNNDKIMETDKKMLQIIKSVVKDEKDILFEKAEEEKEKRKEIDSNIMPSLIQYYVAINNDNLDLLHKLLDSNFNWGNYERGDMNLFVLDKKISSKFKKDEYINIVENYTEIFKNFYSNLYYSSRKNKDFNQEEIIEKFCNIMKYYNKNNIKKEFTRLFTVDLLNCFTEEEILNLTTEQKSNLVGISGFKNRNDKESQLKLDLIKNHNFSKEIICWRGFSEYFSKEEILNLSEEDIKLFQTLLCSYSDYYDGSRKEMEEEAIYKLKQIKKEKPEFNINLDIMGYSVLSTKQILSMTEECANRINRICSNYVFYSTTDRSFSASENTLRKWIKERYHKEKIKKILVKRK